MYGWINSINSLDVPIILPINNPWVSYITCLAIKLFTEFCAKHFLINFITGWKYKVGKCQFAANGRAKIIDDAEGFVKVLTCSKTDTILGVHIIGAYADTLINELW